MLNIYKMAKDTAIVILLTENSKLYISFRMVPFSMTLSDL